MPEGTALPTVAIPGFALDSLGDYLASLGLAHVLARSWPSVRVGWNEDRFCVVGGPATLDDLLNTLQDVGAQNAWTPYDRRWVDAQKVSTKQKSIEPLALWLAQADEDGVASSIAHVVPATALSFNPLLGSGGNAGKRSFSDGWKRATATLKKPGDDARSHLRAALLGEPSNLLLEKLNAASWFSGANKLYNSGQRAFREGVASPWAMALACEGLLFFAGGASRRLGARARLRGAFPFVVSAAAPIAAGENGRDVAEVWVPIWHRPMTVPEITTLFSRGRAEQNGRGASTPAAFAVAIYRRGVDAGIKEFRRFTLGRTTSANTFEPRFAGVVRLHDPAVAGQLGRPVANAQSTGFNLIAHSLARILDLLDQLPVDQSGTKPKFFRLRGPLETALLAVAESPFNTERAIAMLDAAVSVLDRIDRNKAHRKRNITWTPLPLEWLRVIFKEMAPNSEARLAMSIVSSFPVSRPFALYRFGAEMVGQQRAFRHAERVPARWVWGSGQLDPVLHHVLYRSNLDWESEAGMSRNEPVPATALDLDRWLAGRTDDALLSRWLSRIALFDWSQNPSSLMQPNSSKEITGPSAALCLFGLLRPLFDLRKVSVRGDSDLLPEDSGARTPGVARTLICSMRGRNIEAALRIARSRYAVADIELSKTDVRWNVGDPARLLSSMLFSIPNYEISGLLQRWLIPSRHTNERSQYA